MQKYNVELAFEILREKLEEYVEETTDGFWDHDHDQMFKDFVGVTRVVCLDCPRGSFTIKIHIENNLNNPNQVDEYQILIGVEVIREEDFAKNRTQMKVPNPGFVDDFKDYLNRATEYCMKYFEEVVPHV